MAPDTSAELATLLRSKVPLVVIETRDEERVRAMVASAASQGGAPLPVFEWRVTEGLRRVDLDLGSAQKLNSDPTHALVSISQGIPGVYVLIDFHPFLGEPVHVRLLKDIALGYATAARTVVLLSHALDLPPELESYALRFPIAFPTREERRAVVVEIAREWASAQGKLVTANDDAVNRQIGRAHV